MTVSPNPELVIGTDDSLLEERTMLGLAPDTQPTALCLSGGGIRSASFCLGVIQALARHGLLDRFHYLSTVSGGGYVGGCLTRLIACCNDDNPDPADTVSLAQVQAFLTERRNGQEPEPIRGLRRFTNFLTPHPGAFSLDTWAGAMLWLRNTLVNWLVFLPVFVAVVALPVIYFALTCAFAGEARGLADAVGVIGAGCLLAACYGSIMALPSHSHPDGNPATTDAKDFGHTGRELVPRVILPMLAWCLLVPLAVAPHVIGSGEIATARPVFARADTVCAASTDSSACMATPQAEEASPLQLRFVALPAAGLVACLIAYGLAYRRIRGRHPPGKMRKEHLRPFWKSTWAWILSSVLSACLLWYGIWLAQGLNVFWLALAGPVWVGLAEVLRTTLYIAFRKDGLREELDREWLARLNGAKIILLLAGAVVGTAVIVGGMLTASIGDGLLSGLTAGGLTSGTLAAYLGKSAHTAFAARGAEPTRSVVPSTLVINVGIILFGCTLLVLVGRVVALAAAALATFVSGNPAPAYGLIALSAVSIGAGSVILAWWLGRRINLNRFSMHAVYRNRLVRAFLGSARPERSSRPDRFTDFDPFDNMRMADTFDRRSPKALMPVINVALNRTSGRDTARAERMAESFTITPFRCGAATLRHPGTAGGKNAASGAYVTTSKYAGDEKQTGARDEAKGISLGTAMTLSGAAVSPNMGYHSSPLVAFVMTLFNVRLGAWLPNPGAGLPEEDLKRARPRNGVPTLLNELAGRSGRTSDYLYLSDGGHFDNLGLYEMLRRRCRLILVVDASQDEAYAYEDLSRTMRNAWIDLGVAIDFKPSITVREKGLSKHGAFGTITYPSPEGVQPGLLLYLKPWMTDLPPLELAAFQARKGSFPHESTANQFFKESDFESYRRLGECVAETVITGALEASEDLGTDLDKLERIFAALARRVPNAAVGETGTG